VGSSGLQYLAPYGLGGTESLQLFVGCESDLIRVVSQKGSEQFFLPDLPGIRILLRGPRMLGGAPEVFPSLATLVDPQSGVGSAADALGALDKVMCLRLPLKPSIQKAHLPESG
jgi:hypothetical protein